MRELINEDGRLFADEIDQVKAELAGLPNDDRKDFRNRNSSAIACHPARRLLIVAGPGSGKSVLFLDRIRYWLAQDASARIYVSTFVRKLVLACKLVNRMQTDLTEGEFEMLVKALARRFDGEPFDEAAFPPERE